MKQAPRKWDYGTAAACGAGLVLLAVVMASWAGTPLPQGYVSGALGGAAWGALVALVRNRAVGR